MPASRRAWREFVLAIGVAAVVPWVVGSGPGSAPRVLAGLLLVTAAANAFLPASWSRPWTRSGVAGALAVVLGCALLALAQTGRVDRYDLPYFRPEQTGPVLWTGAAALFVAGGWALLRHLERSTPASR